MFHRFFKFKIINSLNRPNKKYKKMKIKLLLLLSMTILLSSCSAIFYGTSTDVMITSPNQGEVVNLFGIGPKDTVRYNAVTLPHNMKVKHNNLPLRMTVEAADNTVTNFTVGAVPKGKKIAKLVKPAAWTAFGASALLTYVVTAMGGIGAGVYLGGSYALLVSPMFVLGYTIETTVPDAPEYYVDIQKTEGKEIKPSLTEYETDDIYKLLDNSDYTMAECKIDYLITKGETAELYYLMGITRYNLGKYKKAIKDLEKAYSLTNPSKDFQLQNAIVEAMRVASDRKTRRQEKTLVAIKLEKYIDKK